MAQYRITLNKKKCEGTGVCASMCPENWEVVDTPSGRKAKAKKSFINEEEYDSNSLAADSCPTDAISIEKVKKRQSAIEEEEDLF